MPKKIDGQNLDKKDLECSSRLLMLRRDKLVKMDEANIPGTERDREFSRELAKRFAVTTSPRVVTILPPSRPYLTEDSLDATLLANKGDFGAFTPGCDIRDTVKRLGEQLPFTVIDENVLHPEFLNDDITKLYPNDVRDSPTLMKVIKKRVTLGGKKYITYTPDPKFTNSTSEKRYMTGPKDYSIQFQRHEFAEDLFPEKCELDSMSEYQPPVSRKPRDLLEMKNHGVLNKKSFPKQKHKRY